jgi:hypothetical protein
MAPARRPVPMVAEPPPSSLDVVPPSTVMDQQWRWSWMLMMNEILETAARVVDDIYKVPP